MQKKYNILLTTMRLDIGGAETHIVELAKGLSREGFRVIAASKGGIYEKELSQFGIKHYTVPLDNKKPHNVIKAYKFLKDIIIKENIDLVHAHARIPGFICGILHNKMKFPFVTTAHGTWKTGYGLKYITNWGQKTIAVSEDVKKYLTDNYKINEEDIKVTINGIDTKKFSPDADCSRLKSEFGIDDDTLKIVYISRLDHDRKDIIFQLLDIIPTLNKNINKLRVIIVGGGNILEQVKSKAAEINKSCGADIVTAPGARTDISEFVSLCDLFIGFGRSSLEALSAQKPLILAGNAGYIGLLNQDTLKLAVNSNFSGRGQRKADNDTFMSDILNVLTKMDKAQRDELGVFGRKLIEEKYSINKMVKDNVEVYMKLLNKKQ